MPARFQGSLNGKGWRPERVSCLTQLPSIAIPAYSGARRGKLVPDLKLVGTVCSQPRGDQASGPTHQLLPGERKVAHPELLPTKWLVMKVWSARLRTKPGSEELKAKKEARDCKAFAWVVFRSHSSWMPLKKRLVFRGSNEALSRSWCWFTRCLTFQCVPLFARQFDSRHLAYARTLTHYLICARCDNSTYDSFIWEMNSRMKSKFLLYYKSYAFEHTVLEKVRLFNFTFQCRSYNDVAIHVQFGV